MFKICIFFNTLNYLYMKISLFTFVGEVLTLFKTLALCD